MIFTEHRGSGHADFTGTPAWVDGNAGFRNCSFAWCVVLAKRDEVWWRYLELFAIS